MWALMVMVSTGSTNFLIVFVYGDFRSISGGFVNYLSWGLEILAKQCIPNIYGFLPITINLDELDLINRSQLHLKVFTLNQLACVLK